MNLKQSIKRVDSLLRNQLTRLGTSKSRNAHNKINTGWHRLGRDELDALWKSKIMRRVSTQIAKDANTAIKIQGDDDLPVKEILFELDRLRASTKVAKLGGLANHYGGAAIWMVFEGGGAPEEEINWDTVEGIKNLVLINRFELSATAPTAEDRASEGGMIRAAGSFYNVNPKSPNFGLPYAYWYTPGQGGGQTKIHASRLIRMDGDDVPPHLSSVYEGWGAPIPESLYNTWAQMEHGKEHGAELLGEFGLMLYNLENLLEIMSGDQRSQLDEWMELQHISKGLLRGMLLGKGMSAERAEVKAQGWTDIYDRLLQMFASEAEYPITLLYGQAPGGLSTDDASAWRNWSKRVSNYQTQELDPVYLQLALAVMRCKSGPTKGVAPDHLQIAFEPYEVPSKKEEAEAASIWAATIEKTIINGIATEDEARATAKAQIDGMVWIEEEEEEGAGDPLALMRKLAPEHEASTPEAPATQSKAGQAAPKIADQALNGAQIGSMVDIVERVHAGSMPPQSGMAILKKALPTISEEEAREIVMGGLAQITPPEEGEGAALPRQDASDITHVEISEGHGKGLMVALYPPIEFARWLAQHPAVSMPAEELHITLCYVPEVDEEDYAAIVSAVNEVCATATQALDFPLSASITGPSIFQNEQDAHVLLIGCVGLSALRFAVRGALSPWIDSERYDFIPHMTIAYKETGSTLPDTLTRQPLKGFFDVGTVSIVHAGKRTDLTLSEQEQP